VSIPEPPRNLGEGENECWGGVSSRQVDTPDRANWDLSYELLNAGQYEELAKFLNQAATASKPGGDVGLVRILAAAHRICLILSQCRAELEWHQQAYQQVDQREHELRQQLEVILNLISEPKTYETHPTPLPEPGPSEHTHSPKQSKLWQWVRRRLDLERPPPAALHDPAVSASEAPSALSAETARLPVAARTAEQPVTNAPSLVAYCLGPFRVYQNDRQVTAWNGLKGLAILKYLVAHFERPVAKDILMAVFWPDANPEAARRNLHQAIYSLRQTLRQRQPDFQHIHFENDCYSLNPELDTWIDYREFESHFQTGRRLDAAGKLAEAVAEYSIAEGLFQGDFMDEDLYEDWPQGQRKHFRNIYWETVERLAEYYMGQAEYTAAIALCQKVLAQDNCYEEAYRRLMQCYLAQGQRHLAVRQYQTCVEVLKQELDLMPSEETVTLYRHITTA
jgi:DNA-binding SARP family transcriptional activator